jgi:hypothetical protein
MKSPFATIEYGPFQAQYHIRQVNADFKETLEEYLSRELLPQASLEYDSTEGSLKAQYDEERYCGPNSLVKDIYRLEFSFVRGSEREHTTQDVIYNPKKRGFTVRRGKVLYLWNMPRQRQQRENQQRVSALLAGIAEGEPMQALCPLCDGGLRVVNTAGLFDVTCPAGCFAYHLHKDPKTGEGLHGHSRMKEPP